MVKVRLKLNVVHVLQQLTATRQKRVHLCRCLADFLYVIWFATLSHFQLNCESEKKGAFQIKLPKLCKNGVVAHF